MQHPLTIRPAMMHLEGQDWVPAAWAFALADALREKQRSAASHNHQFAAINDCFESLPIHHAQAPYAANADAFRKHGLIATGHCDVDTVAFASDAEARKAAPFIANLARKAHGYALTVARGPLVICSTPHSQSFKAMGRERFHKSKADVLAWAETLLEVRK
jgi:hypothetical protein